jgi:fumarate hydratase subunit alpha
MKLFHDSESCDLGKISLGIILENAVISGSETMPLCQDCGMTMVFLEIGQDLNIDGDLKGAVNKAVSESYRGLFLRPSIVSDPMRRINTGDNTPACMHADIVQGSRLKITVYLKGGGSENMTRLKMFNPTVDHDKIIEFIAEAVFEAGSNPCPPLFLGVGIGGSADAALLNSKKAVLRGLNAGHEDPFYFEMEEKIMDRCNSLGVGPLGFGGKTTVAGVFIKTAPAHIASLPVAINMNCHALRFASEEI